jgi:ribosomal protein S25
MSYSSNYSWRVQKWSKGKQREKVANKVLFDEEGYQRLTSEIPKVRPHDVMHLVRVLGG